MTRDCRLLPLARPVHSISRPLSFLLRAAFPTGRSFCTSYFFLRATSQRVPFLSTRHLRLRNALFYEVLRSQRSHRNVRPTDFGSEIRSSPTRRTEKPVCDTDRLVWSFATSTGVFLPNPQRFVWPPRRSAIINLVAVFVTRNIVVSRFCKKSTCDLGKRLIPPSAVTFARNKAARDVRSRTTRIKNLRGIFGVERARHPRQLVVRGC